MASGRASLGVELRSLPIGGVIVAGVATGGPSASAGVRPGDRIAAIAGERIDTWMPSRSPSRSTSLATACAWHCRSPTAPPRVVTLKLGQLPGR